MNRDAGTLKGWGVDGQEKTNSHQKPIPPNGVVIDKIKFYVLNFYHNLASPMYLRVTPWKPLEEVQWDQREVRRNAPESEKHARRPNVLPPDGAGADWWRNHTV